MSFARVRYGFSSSYYENPTNKSDSMEKAVKSIHQTQKSSERNKRVTIDLPISLYKKIHGKTIEEEITLKDYFLTLAEKDLKNAKS